MRYLVRFIPHAVLFAILAAFLHYTLPQKDIARIIDGYERRVDFGLTSIFWAKSPAGTANLETRDVFFIDAAMPDGSLMVYRNEDTGFGWPPYFKVDSANLNAEAKTLASTEEDPVWLAITHYGWRSEFLTIYPNAISIEKVSGPDVSTIPWFSLILLAVLAVLFFILYRVTRRFYVRRIAPVLERLGSMFRYGAGMVGSLWRSLASLFRRSGG
ncbi:MAG: DUF1523 family protein [Rhodobacteraceae bacterium]|nr:DUF1523 family protein [Paracoccaceae bacterium]MCY4137007.1 DUF1523 family protein [Paracoccaceae bacterium]